VKKDISKITELRLNPKNIIIDLRMAWAYDCARIPGTLNVPADELLWRIGALTQRFDTPIYLFCTSGAKSGAVCEELEETGYLNVHDLGLLSGWKHGFETPFGLQEYEGDT